MMTTFEHPLVGTYQGMTRAIKFGRTPGPKPFAAPVFGQHSDAVLEQLGFTELQRTKLRNDSVVK